MNLTEYMSGTIERIVQSALKSTLKNPKESAFLMKYAVSVKAAARKRNSSETKGIHIPPFLIASIASTCNLHCKGCYARANHSCGEQKYSEDLTAAQWKNIFHEAENLGVSFILLAGGEPLMRRDVIEEAAKIPQIIFPIFTNGTMMSGPCFDLIDKNRNLIPVMSIEGNQAQTDARRGEGVYRTLQSTMEKMQKKDILFGASVTVTKKNLTTVTGNEFIASLHEKGCKLVFFVEYVPVGGADNLLAPADPERGILAQRQAELRNKYEDMILLSFPGDEKSVGGCLAAGRGFFHISSTGSAEPCPFSPYSDTNLKDSTLEEALQSPLFLKLSAEGLLSREHTGGCVLFEQEQTVMQLASS